MGIRVALAVVMLLFVLGASWAQGPAAPRDDVLVIPGAPDDYWKAASLTGVAPTGPRFLLEFIRAIEAMEIHDTARLRSVYEYLNPQQSRSQAGRSFTVPVPLRLSAWSKLVSSSSPTDLFSSAMKDRRTRRLLYGAAALNPETRQYLEGRTALVERLHRNHSDVFAVLGRSFSVREGRVDVPGGATAVELWELVVGAPVSTKQRQKGPAAADLDIVGMRAKAQNANGLVRVAQECQRQHASLFSTHERARVRPLPGPTMKSCGRREDPRLRTVTERP